MGSAYCLETVSAGRVSQPCAGDAIGRPCKPPILPPDVEGDFRLPLTEGEF